MAKRKTKVTEIVIDEVMMAASFYGKVNDAKLQEIMDSRMIQEDRKAIANLSPHVINKTFSSSKFMESLGKCDEYFDVGSKNVKK